MSGSDRFGRGTPLAMAKSDSPWGGDDGNDDNGKGVAGKPGGEVEVSPPLPAPEPPPADGPAATNPWLTPEPEPTPRRSASIDDIFRNRRGGGNSGGGAGNGPGGGLLPQGNALALRWLPWLFSAAFAAWLASTSVHILAQDERALVSTMGRFSETIGPGLHLTLPWPLQTVLRQQTGLEATSLLPEKEAETLMLTKDGELVDLSFQVRWRISDLRQFTFNLPEGEAAVRRLADAEMRASVAELPFDALWTGKRQAELQQRVLGRVQKVLDAWHSGVTVAAIEVLRTGPPGRLNDTFRKIGAAREEASKNRERAAQYRDQVVKDATSEAGDFDQAYATYKLAPAVTRSKMYYEMIERVLRNNPVVVGGTGMPATAPPAPDAKPDPAPQAGGK